MLQWYKKDAGGVLWDVIMLDDNVYSRLLEDVKLMGGDGYKFGYIDKILNKYGVKHEDTVWINESRELLFSDNYSEKKRIVIYDLLNKVYGGKIHSKFDMSKMLEEEI